MYIDTSALVPLYALETDSARCEAIVSAGDGLFSSELVIGEMTGTLLAKERAGLITPALRAEIQSKFDEHVAAGLVRLISLNGMTVHEGAEIMHRVHPLPLRTLDALHLATCLGVEAGPLFTRDQRMRAAAVKLGVPLAD